MHICYFLPNFIFSADSGRKLTLLYVANDVIQNSKKKGPEYRTEFVKVLPRVFQGINKLVHPLSTTNLCDLCLTRIICISMSSRLALVFGRIWYALTLSLVHRKKDDSLIKSTERIISVWEERHVFDAAALSRFKAGFMHWQKNCTCILSLYTQLATLKF